MLPFLAFPNGHGDWYQKWNAIVTQPKICSIDLALEQGGANKLLLEAVMKHSVKLCLAVSRRAAAGSNKLIAQ